MAPASFDGFLRGAESAPSDGLYCIALRGDAESSILLMCVCFFSLSGPNLGDRASDYGELYQ